MVERSLSTQHDIPAERDLLSNMIAVAAFEPGWSLWDLWSSLQAPKFAEAATFTADATYDARRLGTDYPLPFFIITGAEDQITPSDLARRYFDTIRAPKKEFVVLPGAGHDAVLTGPEIFLRTLITEVRPAAEHATASAV
jgi:pimeloyl-ACP methyl ester carboxylesterase